MKLRNFGSWFFRWGAPLLVLLSAGCFVYAMGSRSKPNRKKAPPRKSIPVEIVRVQSHAGSLDIVTSGVAIPYREVKLSSQVGGEVVFKAESLSPGGYVNKGDVLLKIDSQNFEIEVARLEQELARSTVDKDRLEVDRENAERLLAVNRKVVEVRKRNVARLEKLRRANASTMSELDATELALLTALEQSTVHENTIRQFASQTRTLEMAHDLIALQLKRAHLDLARATIVAPFSGIVIANHVEQNGSIVAGMPVATIEDTSMAEIRCNLRPEDLALLHDNSAEFAVQSDTIDPRDGTPDTRGLAYRLPPIPATIELQRAGQVWKWDGVLSRLDGLGMDQKTRTMPVRIRVAKPTCNSGQPCVGESDSPADSKSIALLRGMFVRVKLHCQPQAPMTVIPESVVRPGKAVWLLQDNTLRILHLRIARIQGGQAFVEGGAGLSVGDQIISSPVQNARDGLPVSLVSKNRTSKNSGDADGRRTKQSQGQRP